MEVLEIPKVVVSGLCLRDFIVRFGLARVDDIGELESILNEEDWNVVADNVPVTLVGVKLHGKATNISDGIRTASASQDGREAEEDGGCARSVSQNASRSNVRGTLKQPKGTKGASASGVNNTLGNLDNNQQSLSC